MEKNLGILLKNYSPKKHKVSIFDKNLGRIEAIFQNTAQTHQLHHGASLLYYCETTNSTLYKIKNIEIMDMPLELAKTDIYFLHHVLELCYYFLPLHVGALDTFTVIEAAFKYASANKFLILLRFFTSLGIYPEDIPLEKTFFHRLLSCPIETILEEKLDDAQVKMLESWLLRCIEIHPYKKQFKTKLPITKMNIV